MRLSFCVIGADGSAENFHGSVRCAERVEENAVCSDGRCLAADRLEQITISIIYGITLRSDYGNFVIVVRNVFPVGENRDCVFTRWRERNGQG